MSKADTSLALVYDRRDDAILPFRLIKRDELKTFRSDAGFASSTTIVDEEQYESAKPSAKQLICEAFDANWYRIAHPDLRDLELDCLSHYLDYGRYEGRAPRADFDPRWYAAHYLGEMPACDAFLHWAVEGRAKGFHPNISSLVRSVVATEFDSAYYLMQYPDLSVPEADLVAHYLDIGVREGRNPHPEFDAGFYLRNNDDVRQSGLNPFFHYIAYGRAENRPGRAWSVNPSPNGEIYALLDATAKRADVQEAMFGRVYANGADYALDAECLFFDAQWYWDHAQRGTREADLNPLVHYRTIGWTRHYWPHPLFDPALYIRRCNLLGVQIDGDPLQHYHDVGARSGVSPHPLFDHEWYRCELVRVGRSSEDASLTDYLYHGWRQGLDPHPLFCSRTYRERAEPGAMAELHHYAMVGWHRRVSPHALFDFDHYLRHAVALVAFRDGLDPLSHYLAEGSAVGLSPHPDFDTRWYADLFCAPSWERSTLEHFVWHADRPRARISTQAEFDFRTMATSAAARDNRIGDSPLVSIIIVNWNGAHHLSTLFESLSRQTYDHYEVVFVDNASEDLSLDIVSEKRPSTKVVALDRNAGFAEANNLGYAACRGELIVLLNNDTCVDANWLSELVACAGRNPSAGAITSRVRFWWKFRLVTIKGSAPFSLHYAELVASLDYKKCIVGKGKLTGGAVEAVEDGHSHVIEIKVPADERAATFALQSEFSMTCWLDVAGLKRRKAVLDGGITDTVLDLAALPSKNALFVINNAGSCEPSWLVTGDIGFGEFDNGQHGQEREVPLACGCAMLVRRAALLGAPLFVSDFVAYFEDSELSRRLRKTGHSIIYSPGAIVYHKHSSTATEHSPFWIKQLRRNRIIYNYLGTARRDRHAYLHREMLDLNHYWHWLSNQEQSVLTHDERIYLDVLHSIMQEVRAVCAKIDAGTHMGKQTSIGIFNRFWATLGGGEAHALFIASYLSRFGTIELISESDFDLDEVTTYFNVDATHLRKRVIGRLTTAITAEYDLFVNSAYMDETPSRAKHSFFIVSFPSRQPSIEFLTSYTFLANSSYTSRWIKRWWSHAKPNVRLVEPVVSDALLPCLSSPSCKKQVLLSVGRFFTTGHSKNQLEIVRAFKSAGLDGWTLKLAGSIGEQSYFDAVATEARDSAIELHPNASFNVLKDLYGEASIYVHASGLGRSPEEEPENFEHFGMTVAEAAANGCLPVVFDAAGPADIVRAIGEGIIYDSETDLCRALTCATLKTLNDLGLSHRLQQAASVYSREVRLSMLESTFAEAEVDFSHTVG